MNTEQLKAIALDALDDVKAKNIVILDVKKLTSLFECLIVASGESNRQVRALANNVREKVKAAGGEILGMEGENSGEWVLVDCGDIVVHVMQPAVRDYYNLEGLWGGEKPAFVATPTMMWKSTDD